MDRRKFICGLLASAAAIPVVAALPAVQAEANWFGIVSDDVSKRSVWLVAWGENACSAVYPKGSKESLVFDLPDDDDDDDDDGIIRCYEPTKYIDPRQRGA